MQLASSPRSMSDTTVVEALRIVAPAGVIGAFDPGAGTTICLKAAGG
jgi:hypothetical protein